MRSAFVDHKDLTDIYIKFTLAFWGRSVDVYIWRGLKGLRANTYFQDNDHAGAYVYYPYRKARSGLFGEIHLIKRLVGAGYVAHEIQHFLYDWMTEQTVNAALNEKMATLAGEITKDFWHEYNKRIP